MKRIAALSLLAAVTLGCDDGARAPSGPASKPATPAPTVTLPPQQVVPPAAPAAVEEPVHVGMGAKGHYGGPGLVTTPVAAYWRTQDRLAIQQLIQAMRIYEAMNNGCPKTHDEFMEKIVKANMIRLPVLPPGQEYIYDPTQVDLPENTGLMVRRPAE